MSGGTVKRLSTSQNVKAPDYEGEGHKHGRKVLKSASDGRPLSFRTELGSPGLGPVSPLMTQSLSEGQRTLRPAGPRRWSLAWLAVREILGWGPLIKSGRPHLQTQMPGHSTADDTTRVLSLPPCPRHCCLPGTCSLSSQVI